MAERLKARLSKSRRGAILSRVQIPPPPPKIEIVRRAVMIFCGVYYTKFECILKATLMSTNRTRGARAKWVRTKVNTSPQKFEIRIRSRNGVRKQKCGRHKVPPTTPFPKRRLVLYWCLYCTKLAPISKTNDVARSACVVKRN